NLLTTLHLNRFRLMKNQTLREFRFKNSRNILTEFYQMLTSSSASLNESTYQDETVLENTFMNNINIPEDAIYFEHPEEMLIPWVINPYFFPIIITYIITFIIGVSGNLVVILFMAGDKTNRSGTSIFLVSLAVSDLLLLTIYAPLEVVANYFVIQWDKESTVCKLAAFAESVSAFASVLNLVAVTFERFVVIVFPIHSRSLCTMNNCKRLMIFVWVFSFFMAIPVTFIKNTVKNTFTNYEITVTMFVCKEPKDWRAFAVSIYRFVTLFALPSILMIACYTWVIIELWISTKTMNELTQHNSIENRGMNPTTDVHEESASPVHTNRVILRSHVNNEHKDIKAARQQVIKMLILIVVLFLVCWGPRLLMEVIIKCCLDVFNHGTYTLRIVFYLLPFIHSCLNPIVYCLMSTKFRRRILSCFHRFCASCRRRDRVTHIRLTTTSTLRSGHLSSVYTLTSVTRSLNNMHNANE
ncbi:type-1 angiotensin II receptor-like isoform X1, partial [Dinothrombium tinctorium]